MHELVPITKDVNLAVDSIRSGRIAAYPTGTSYGLGADVLQGNALQRLRNVKQRPDDKTFTVALKQELWEEFFDITDAERTFLSTHQNSALTVLLKPREKLSHIAQDGLVGLRVVDHRLMNELVSALDVPITATSANISGEMACYDTECVKKSFPGLLDPSDTRHGDIKAAGPTTYDLSVACILDGGVLEAGKQSTIVKIKNGKPTIIRQGSFLVQ